MYLMTRERAVVDRHRQKLLFFTGQAVHSLDPALGSRRSGRSSRPHGSRIRGRGMMNGFEIMVGHFAISSPNRGGVAPTGIYGRVILGGCCYCCGGVFLVVIHRSLDERVEIKELILRHGGGMFASFRFGRGGFESLNLELF